MFTATASGAVALFLSLFAAPSTVHVNTAVNPVFHSVAYFDDQIDLTNHVLDRTIAKGIVRDATNFVTNEFSINYAKIQKQAVETHCQLRLKAENIPNAAQECGPGFVRN